MSDWFCPDSNVAHYTILPLWDMGTQHSAPWCVSYSVPGEASLLIQHRMQRIEVIVRNGLKIRLFSLLSHFPENYV